jgi:hypothetical protein
MNVKRNDINHWNEIDSAIKAKKNPIYSKGYKYYRK